MDIQELQQLQLQPTNFEDIEYPTLPRSKRWERDENLYVRFHKGTKLMIKESKEKNRPIYKNVDMVEIMVPGDRRSIIDREASDIDKRRFQRQYEAYKKGVEAEQVGTPLRMMPWIDEAMIQELAYYRITTVEQLAGLNDSVAQNFPGIQGFKTKAIEFLGAGTDNKVKTLEDRLAEKDKVVEQLQKRLEALENSKPVRSK